MSIANCIGRNHRRLVQGYGNTGYQPLEKMTLFARLIIMLTLVGVVSGECTNCHRCVDDTCSDPVNNICFCVYGCKPGYRGDRCLHDCPEQCYTCGRHYGWINDPTYEICYECKYGYHNGSSTNCLCPINCQQCTSTTQCTLCYPGWHGTTCQSSCPLNCKDQTCRKSDGMCTDGCSSSSFVGDYCNDCKSGLYGDNCHLICSTNCKDNTCRKSDGVCINGCSSSSFVGDYCNDCKSGLYGDNCHLICSTNCKDNTCRKSDGYCTSGCRNGWYGTSCNLQCSFFCNESECHQDDGVCYECISGKYKSYCETDCKSDTCLYNKCERNSGLCTIGCSGNLILGTDNLCQACKAGKYGSTCDIDCISQNCKNNKCDKITGTCIDEQETTADTSPDISFVIGWVFGGCAFTVNVALVIYICYKRRHTTTAETKRETERNDNEVAYINTDVEIVAVQPEQVITYEDLKRRTDAESSEYSVIT
ncbi:hypothetical protein ACF0H5_019976 [Mactra antiquata]